jgi:hypothetical protein
MKPVDRYRQCWPETERNQSSKPGAVWLAVVTVAQTLATLGTIYLIVVFAFSL